MKLSLILVAALALIGCTEEQEPKEVPSLQVEDHVPLPGGGSYYNPCGRVYVIEFETEAGTYRKEVPIYCAPYGVEPYGDPPDYRTPVDFDPWEEQIIPVPEQIKKP